MEVPEAFVGRRNGRVKSGQTRIGLEHNVFFKVLNASCCSPPPDKRLSLFGQLSKREATYANPGTKRRYYAANRRNPVTSLAFLGTGDAITALIFPGSGFISVCGYDVSKILNRISGELIIHQVYFHVSLTKHLKDMG